MVELHLLSSSLAQFLFIREHFPGELNKRQRKKEIHGLRSQSNEKG